MIDIMMNLTPEEKASSRDRSIASPLNDIQLDVPLDSNVKGNDRKKNMKKTSSEKQNKNAVNMDESYEESFTMNTLVRYEEGALYWR